MPHSASRPYRRHPTLAAAVAAVLASTILGCGTGGNATHIAIGRKVAPLELVPLVDPSQLAVFPDGNAFDAASAQDAKNGPSLEGRVTLLNFWGTWCPPCRRELPGMVRLADRLVNEPRFQLVAVSCGTGPRDDLDVIRGETLSFLRERKLDLVPWADPDGRTRFQFAATMDFSAYPTTYLIGPDATVRQVWVGYRSRDEADIAAAVVAMLRSASASRRRNMTEEEAGSAAAVTAEATATR
jgi:thiol-disulfide isomerase/thioredoxin